MMATKERASAWEMSCSAASAAQDRRNAAERMPTPKTREAAIGGN
jgi:hypothetical protein